MNYQIINTCGTSVLTNPARGDRDLYDALTQYSNVKDETKIPHDVYEKIQDHWNKLINLWSEKEESAAKNASAELNCLLTWQRKNKIEAKDCFCYLVHTDTVFGLLAAQIVEEWLKVNKYQGVIVQKIASLSTDNLESFEVGLSNLVKWAFDLKNSDTKSTFIFNTAGGFKSVSGFTQTLGTFLADETIYKFEGGDEVLEIPRLPIIWNETDSLKKHFNDYHKISLGIPLPTYSHLNTLWVKNGMFSPWGQLAWENAKQEIYGQKVLPFAYENVVEGNDFRESIKGLDKNRVWQINERIDDLCKYKYTNGDLNPNRLDYKKLKGKHPYTHECDAWADSSANRLFCNEKDGKIIVEKLDKHL